MTIRMSSVKWLLLLDVTRFQLLVTLNTQFDLMIGRGTTNGGSQPLRAEIL